MPAPLGLNAGSTPNRGKTQFQRASLGAGGTEGGPRQGPGPVISPFCSPHTSRCSVSMQMLRGVT